MTGRTYAAAELSRLTEDWTRTPVAPNQDIRNAHQALLARARELYQNSSFIKGYIHHRLPAQILGARGIQMRPAVRRTRGTGINNTTNRRLVEAWEEWGMRGSCTMDGMSSWVDVQKQVLEAIVRDGEVLIQFVRGRQTGNPYNFALHLLEAEHLDSTYDIRTRAGNLVIMGVEVNRWRKPLAYHIQVENPNDVSFQFRNYTRDRVPASSLLHPFVRMYPSQRRGVSWLHAGAADGRQLAMYREAELVAARVAASKAVFYETDDIGSAAPIEGFAGRTTEDGRVVYPIDDEVEPGQASAVPPGWKVTSVDPTHPNGNFADFETAILRGLAASVGASYHGFSGDLSEVNYSSARMGAIDEREVFRAFQRWYVSHVVQPIFSAWLDMAVLGPLRIPASTLEQVKRQTTWQARGFASVDPAKESAAVEADLSQQLTSRQRVLASRGESFTEVLDELVEEQALLDEAGLGQPPPRAEDDDAENEDEDEDADGGDESDDSAGEDDSAPRRRRKRRARRRRRSR